MDTYTAPRDGWVCFHCGKRFYEIDWAREHFGYYPTSKTACLLGVEGIREELRKLRRLEMDWKDTVTKTRLQKSNK